MGVLTGLRIIKLNPLQCRTHYGHVTLPSSKVTAAHITRFDLYGRIGMNRSRGRRELLATIHHCAQSFNVEERLFCRALNIWYIVKMPGKTRKSYGRVRVCTHLHKQINQPLH